MLLLLLLLQLVLHACAAVSPQSWGDSPPPGCAPFLTLFVVRINTGSRDFVIKRALIDIDDLEVDIDADMLNGLNVRTPQIKYP